VFKKTLIYQNVLSVNLHSKQTVLDEV